MTRSTVVDPLEAFDLSRVPWSLVMAFTSLGLIYVLFRHNRGLFHELGFDNREMVLLILGSVAGWAVNVPVLIIGGTYVAVNLGGAIVPIMLIVSWAMKRKLRPVATLVGTTLVALLTWRIVEFHASSGIVTRYPLFFLPILAPFAYALLVSIRRPVTAVPIAYASGTLGALIGADLMHLPEMYAYFQSAPEKTIISLGGAGVFDMVFLAGTFAMALTLVTLTLLGKRGKIRVQAAPPQYPGRAWRLQDSGRVWASYLKLENPTASERALAGLALSDLALREGDFPRSVRMSWLAVDSLLRAEGVKERVDTTAPVALHEDVALLSARYRTSKETPVPLRDAGEANATARLLLGALLAPQRLEHRLEGVT